MKLPTKKAGQKSAVSTIAVQPAAAPPVPAITDQLNEQRRRVDYDTFDISVQQLLAMTLSKQIDTAPAYQRHFRWKTDRQSQFIESVFLGIPVPSMFMAANSDGSWELVDGVQRLSTLIHFTGDQTLLTRIGAPSTLRLTDLEKLTSLNGKTYSELPESAQNMFVLKSLKVVTISDKSDPNVRFDVFERLNTGGVQLTAQEIRACVYRGVFNDFLEDRAKFAPFRTVARIPPKSMKDGTPEEWVLRFFAFLNGYKKFEHSVVEFLNAYMREANRSTDLKGLQSIFENTFRQLAKIFPHGIRRGQGHATPVNLFEGVSVGAALTLRDNTSLKPDPIPTWIDTPDLRAATTAATNAKKNVVFRIEFCKKHLGG